MIRQAKIREFLSCHGFGSARAEPLAQDASFRRYVRLVGGPRPAVLMDAPPPEDVRPFLRIGGHLAGIGVTVPAIFAEDEAGGLLIEEDLGDGLISRFMDADSPTGLIDGVVDTLVAIQRVAPTVDLPRWDASAMRTTAMGTLFDWWWPAAFREPAPDDAREDFSAALESMLTPVALGPTSFVHRDFFAENLLWLPSRCGIARIGVIDFQGAAIGHPAYDLVSLLQDARRDIPRDLAEYAMQRYLDARPDLDRTQFFAAYAACAAQRHLRVACQWVRLARRDNRPGYLMHGPRTWQLLQRAVSEPAAAPLARALDRWVPTEKRGNPP
jgi:N-acetylmuramate 1-kinase